MSRRGKKSFDVEWERDGLKIKVPVKIHVPCGEFMEESKIYFTAKHKDSSLNIRNDSADEIKNKIIEHLNGWYSVEWEIYMLVKIHGGRGRGNDDEFDINVEVDYYAVGTHNDGKIIHVSIPKPDQLPKKPHEKFKKIKRRWQVSPNDGMPETGYIEKTDHWNFKNKPVTKALLPATQRVADAVEVFMRKMDLLLANMHADFHPDQATKTLKMLDKIGLNLLPPAEEK